MLIGLTITYLRLKTFKISDISKSQNSNFLSFQFVLQGGFDGVNIFDKNEYNLSNNAATADMLDADRGRLTGATVASYLSALKLVGSTSTVDMKLLAIPGIREPAITNAAAEVAEERFDTLYLMDIEQLNDDENPVEISQLQAYDNSLIPNVNYTSNKFNSRYIKTTFAAAYFPDVVIEIDSNVYQIDSTTVPPSVAALGAMSLNDRLGQPWFAPAGITRGALNNTSTTTVKLNEEQRNLLYSGSINPIYSPGNANGQASGAIIWGQKTLGSKNTLLNRISVRRLLLEIRREIRSIATQLIFENGRQNVLNALESRISQTLLQIQRNGGLQEYRIDTSQTASLQPEIENNTIRIRVYVRPNGTNEFASVDVTVGAGGNSEI
ncbi:hypothetical protein EBS02_05970 [bacterium]|nr:hypothetical protein [bacterium]